MTEDDRLLVDTVDLRRRAGTRRDCRTEARIAGLTMGESSVVNGLLQLDLVIEAVTEGIVATGTATGRWSMPCRRCLEETQGEFVADLNEIFELHPTEGETWPIEDERIDLTPVLREAALLSLPLAPVCSEDCAGPEPDRFPTGPPEEATAVTDPRWAALDGLTFDE